jgi:hypothetical protein
MMASETSVITQVEAKKAVPKEEHPVGRGPDGGSPQRTKKIFVGGLAPSVDESVLKGYFERFGEVRSSVYGPSLLARTLMFLLWQSKPCPSCCSKPHQ